MQNIYSDKLRRLAQLLDDGEYVEAEKMTFYSPAGDGMGIDSTCISFNGKSGDDAQDIGMVIEKLKSMDKERAIQEHLKEIERIKAS